MSNVSIEQLKTALSKYVPARALSYCINWIAENKIALKITKSRHSKYGDYRPPQNGFGHRISVNGDLNQFAFLITFIHEVAHLNQWKHYKRIIEPHGKLWKDEYKKLMLPMLREKIFPDDVVDALMNYMQNPAATSCTDHKLLLALRNYDLEQEKWMILEEIEIESVFKIRTGRTFMKKEKLRKNYKCLDMRTNHIYFINPVTEVMLL